MAGRAGGVAAFVAFVATVAAHVRFLVQDGRPPRDLCNCQQVLPRVAESVHTSLPAGLADALGALFAPTGWYSMLRLAAVELAGRHPETLQAFDVVAVASVVGLSGLLAWRWYGLGAVGPTTLLVAAMPALVVEGRQGWIHIPEAALVLVAATVWSADRELARRRTILGMAGAGALAILLRPSGLVWVGMLVVLVWGRPWRRAALVLSAWALAALVPLAQLPEYLSAKASARARYAEVIPDLWPQFLVLLGPAVCGVVVVGLGAAGVQLLRRRAVPGRGGVLAAAWVAVALLLAIVFRAGLDNHTLLLVGLALLAGWGLRALPRLGLLLAAVAFAFQHGPQWAPLPGPDAAWWSLPGAWRVQVAPSILNFYVPFPRYGTDQVRRLLDAICDPAPCTVAADQGLYLPYGEEPGVFDTFAAGESRVRLIAVRELPKDRAPLLDALVEFDCPEQDGAWQLRWPEARSTREQLIRRQRLELVWATEVGPGCMVRWLTPRRHVAHPEYLPPER